MQENAYIQKCLEKAMEKSGIVKLTIITYFLLMKRNGDSKSRIGERNSVNLREECGLQWESVSYDKDTQPQEEKIVVDRETNYGSS